ncbi:MAG: cob(I)yrinic acid a,c-diamide adenosyltransferase [bacterium]|nr:cob(I)yrinic acid a,c-diamide adenosyltransferase [bacterium]
MSIYTKKGDSGLTSTLTFKPSKDSLLIEVLGTLDEAVSFLDLAINFSRKKKIILSLQKTQTDLSQIGAILAGRDLLFGQEKIDWLEAEIDCLEKRLPPLKNFVLTSQNKAGAFLQVSRTIIRRAERRAVSLGRKRKIKPAVLSYLNRLSDYIFLLSLDS